MTTYSFSGGSADLITYDGTFCVENGMVADWTLTVASSWSLLPSTTFANIAGQTATYCDGQCVFGETEPSTTLTFRQDDGTKLRLAFDPGLWTEASQYLNMTTGTGAKITWGELSVTTPEPTTAMLLIMAMIGAALLHVGRRLWC